MTNTHIFPLPFKMGTCKYDHHLTATLSPQRHIWSPNKPVHTYSTHTDISLSLRSLTKQPLLFLFVIPHCINDISSLTLLILTLIDAHDTKSQRHRHTRIFVFLLAIKPLTTELLVQTTGLLGCPHFARFVIWSWGPAGGWIMFGLSSLLLTFVDAAVTLQMPVYCQPLVSKICLYKGAENAHQIFEW